ncbi:ABC transporter permease [Streptomyces prunicolor]|uniref:ABC transporter permease n=1 Tax=Streptomyces prunicolor TaxID=67348 RepID=A0ABU4FG82_9ACTN|nr:ABC transporter permease [Streptomyces prunicolor]MDV7219045.1 ABC transporter permease [Streptomyces prunicolor]
MSAVVTVRGRVRLAAKSRALKAPSARWGLALVVLLVLLGIAAPLLTPYSPLAQGPDALLGPGLQHPLGTDEFGRDLLTRTLHGIRLDLLVAGTAVPLGALAGVALGVLCALHPLVDVVLQRAFDVMLAFTALILGVTLAAVLGPGTAAVFWTVAGINVPLFGRITRDATRIEKDREYVLAAQALGAGRLRILVGDILPNILDALIVQAALSLSTAVFVEGAMSFVGIGITPPTPSLGALLRSGASFLDQNPAYALGPVTVVVGLVIGFNLLADGLNKGLLKR